MNTPKMRYRTERRKYTKAQRLRIWWNGIVNSIREIPDTHYSEFILVSEGELGYDEALFDAVVSEHPARFTFQDGKYEPSEDTECYD